MAKKIIGCFFFVLIIIFAASDAASAGDLKGALVGGKPTLDLRYRFEGVGQEGMDKDAAASTLRLRLGYTTKEFNGFSLHVDVENIQVIGKDSYNSTDNGKVDYPVVADPADSELNQVYVKYAGISNTILTLGRQRIKIGNDRFIGNVGWRQNEQTYDAIRLVNRSVSHLTITLAHIMNVNRIFGQHHSSNGDLDMNTNVIHLDYDFSFGRLSAYGYFMDNRDAPQLSHQTIGLRFSGAQTISRPLKVLYSLEYSVQDEYNGEQLARGKGLEITDFKPIKAREKDRWKNIVDTVRSEWIKRVSKTGTSEGAEVIKILEKTVAEVRAGK